MKFVKSVVAHSYRRGKPFGRPSFNNGAKGMVNRTPDNPVVIRGSSAPGLALFFGFTGYMIWQMVQNTRITKATKKCTEYLNEACLRNARVSEGYKEISRLIGKEKDEAEAEADDEDEDEDEAELSGKKVEEDMEMPWWCGSA